MGKVKAARKFINTPYVMAMMQLDKMQHQIPRQERVKRIIENQNKLKEKTGPGTKDYYDYWDEEKKTKNIINNDTVAALVNNESTIKHYRIIDGKSFLVPANKNYKPKRLDESCEIVGKVICLFRDM